MVFRLASRYVIWMQIIIWGKGFAEFVMKKFENEENIFYISTLCKRDVFGRICLKERGFIAMKGYNEALVGYGFEDAEFYDGLES